MFIKNINNFIKQLKKQKYHAKNNFSYDKMKEMLSDILENNVPEISQQVKLNLSQLTKVD